MLHVESHRPTSECSISSPQNVYETGSSACDHAGVVPPRAPRGEGGCDGGAEVRVSKREHVANLRRLIIDSALVDHGQIVENFRHRRLNFRVAENPTGAHVDERGLSGANRERPENWVVRLSDSLIRIARSRLDQQGPIFGQPANLQNALIIDILTRAGSSMMLCQYDFIRRAVSA